MVISLMSHLQGMVQQNGGKAIGLSIYSSSLVSLLSHLQEHGSLELGQSLGLPIYIERRDLSENPWHFIASLLICIQIISILYKFPVNMIRLYAVVRCWLQCLNCKATQYMGGGIRIRNVTLTSSGLFTVTNVS